MNKNFCWIVIILFCYGTIYSSDTLKTSRPNEINVLNYPLIVNYNNNPSVAGFLNKLTVNTNYQRQWLDLKNTHRQLFIGIDYPLINRKDFGMGLAVFGYSFKNFNKEFEFTIEKELTIDISYSVRFSFGDKTEFRWGISWYSYNTIKSTNANDIYPDMIDPTCGIVYHTNEPEGNSYDKHYSNIKTGFWFTHKKFFSGLSFLNFRQFAFEENESIESIEDIEIFSERVVPIEIQFVGGNEFQLKNKFSLTPALEIKKAENIPVIISPSCYATYNGNFLLGATLYNLKIFQASAGFDLFDMISILVKIGMPVNEELYNISSIYNLGGSIKLRF